ncbi:RNA-binding domain-containing protein [Microthyrium microscopicum]|uniref:RNA-binding domain-containing protein n=1 Tax=Microthyrium microscopicum TaxID=703497 RepID=A0A6A6UGD8_9PEZI|nr:RNA-binding domain-containing protein [Microthyrium microscopicum]
MASKAQKSGGTPNQTLYISNLNEKIKKDDLRRQLYVLFSTYGPVLDIVALKTSKMRGQAHITFRDIQTAIQVLRQLDDFEFLGRPMRIQYAKGKSEFISKLDGTFKIPVMDTGKSVATEPVAGEKGTALQQSVFGGAPPAAASTGTKRARDEEEEADAPMEEEEEEEDEADMEMDESDDD